MQYLNKRIAVLGWGEEGQDVFNWLKLNTHDCQIKVFDKIKVVDLSGFDIVFRSPGFYRQSLMITKAEKAGATISSATKLFFELCPCPIIGVTGTKGKGTTTTLISQILTTAGKKCHLAGNIGQSPLSLLPKLKPGHWVCLELSSFQLQDLTVSPHMAVVLNITSEHLDVHQDTKEYRQAKQNLVKHQKPQDLTVINVDYAVSAQLAKLTPAKVYWFSSKNPVLGSFVQKEKIYLNLKGQPQLVGSVTKLLLRGQHNWENITAAIAAAGLAGASLPGIKKTVFNFKGLEHRLELVREVDGIKFYNDSFSTTPETAIVAIKAFEEPTTIILGGSDKGSDYVKLGATIINSSHVKAVVLIGQMADKIEQAMVKAGGFKGRLIRGLTTMGSIVSTTFKGSEPSGVVLLSPACASFDMFKNYKDRGEQFKAAVSKL